MRIVSTFAVTVVLVGLLVSHAFAAPTAKTQICGQKKGPSTSWSDSIPGVGSFKFRGSTWTVFATGVGCSVAMRATPSLLTQWSGAKIGGKLTLKGWHCTKEKSTGYSGQGVSSGTIGCVGKNLAFIAVHMYDPYTLAQIKQVAATGKPPK